MQTDTIQTADGWLWRWHTRTTNTDAIWTLPKITLAALKTVNQVDSDLFICFIETSTYTIEQLLSDRVRTLANYCKCIARTEIWGTVISLWKGRALESGRCKQFFPSNSSKGCYFPRQSFTGYHLKYIQSHAPINIYLLFWWLFEKNNLIFQFSVLRISFSYTCFCVKNPIFIYCTRLKIS